MEAVVIFNDTFRVYIVKFPVGFVGTAAHHQPGIFGGDLPHAVRGGHPHQPGHAVAIDVTLVQAALALFSGIRPGSRTHIVGGGEIVLRTVAGQTGHHIQGVPVQNLLNAAIFQVAHQGVQEVDGHHGPGDLTGMDVGFHIIGRLVFRLSGGGVGDGADQNVPPLGSVADDRQLEKFRMVFFIAVEQIGDFLVAVIVVVRQTVLHFRQNLPVRKALFFSITPKNREGNEKDKRLSHRPLHFTKDCDNIGNGFYGTTMGVDGCWCALWSSKPVIAVRSRLGGFDSHILPPEFIQKTDECNQQI